MVRYIRSRAPLRIGVAGGGTDVDPYASTRGGCVFNSTISKYAYCTLIPRRDKVMFVKSHYYGRYKANLKHGPLKFDGNMDLAKAVANYFEVEDGFTIDIYSDVPIGSGLGGSSTMIVAIIAAVAKWKERNLSKNEIAKLAYHLEREDIGLIGGKQDQYAAAYGGFNLLEVKKDVMVKPITIHEDTINELQCRSVMCFTGMSRESAKIINSQIQLFNNGQNIEALDATKRLANEISSAFSRGDIGYAGTLLDESWQYKKQFSDIVSNKHINYLYKRAMSKGAIGGKISGAGGGGFMYFICEYDKKVDVIQELKKRGAEVTDFMFEPNGVTTWEINYKDKHSFKSQLIRNRNIQQNV